MPTTETTFKDRSKSSTIIPVQFSLSQ